VNSILAAAPFNPCFLAQSPSISPLATARLGKFPSFLAKIIKWLLLHACVNLSCMAGLDPTQKEKKSGSGLGLRPSRPKLCLLRVCLAKHPLCLDHNFYAHSNLIFDQINPLFYNKKFQKYLGPSLIYLWPPHTFFF